jgi:RNA polymerase sigma factor (sigma-70 family)
LEDILAILQGCTRRDRKYQKMLYEQFYGCALKVVYRYIAPYSQAVGTVNDGFVRLFLNFQNFDHHDSIQSEKLFIGWLKKMMVNAAIDALKRQHMLFKLKNQRAYEWGAADNSLNTDQQNLNQRLIEQLRMLPPLARVVFNMHVIDGFSLQEISNRIGISPNICQSNLFKAQAQLKSALKKDHGGAGVSGLPIN